MARVGARPDELEAAIIWDRHPDPQPVGVAGELRPGLEVVGTIMLCEKCELPDFIDIGLMSTRHWVKSA